MRLHNARISVHCARTYRAARARHITLIFHTRFYTRGNYNNNRPPRLIPRPTDARSRGLGSFREIDLTYSLVYANRHNISRWIATRLDFLGWCHSTPPLPRFRFINFTHLNVPTRDAVSLANLRDTKRRLFLFDTTFPLLYTLLIASGVHYAPPPLLNSLPSFPASPLLASLVESRFRSTGLPKRACLRAKSCDRLPYVGVGISFEVSGLIELTSL